MATDSLTPTLSLAVVGGGTMGVGIAYVYAVAGWTVWVVEPDDKRSAVMNQTLKDAAVVLPANASLALAAEAIVEVLDNAPLRGVLASRGHELIQNIEASEGTQKSVKKMLELVA